VTDGRRALQEAGVAHILRSTIGRYGATGAVGVALALAVAAPAQAQTVRVTQAPTMSGVMQVGQTLQASGGNADNETSSTYVWLRCDDNTPNSTVAEERVGDLEGCRPLNTSGDPRRYTLINPDLGKFMRVGLYAKRGDQDHWMVSAPSARVTNPPPPPPPAPTPAPTPIPTVAPAPSPTFDTAASAPVVAPTHGQILRESGPKRRAIRPFPVVRMRGRLTARGARVSLLSVRAPRAAKVTVRCKGHCPRKSWTASKRSKRLTRARAFERSLRSGTRITVIVTRSGYIGKRTTFVIRKGRAPTRKDKCVNSRDRVTTCPRGV
jgi:hypothetical protein